MPDAISESDLICFIPNKNPFISGVSWWGEWYSSELISWLKENIEYDTYWFSNPAVTDVTDRANGISKSADSRYYIKFKHLEDAITFRLVWGL